MSEGYSGWTNYETWGEVLGAAKLRRVSLEVAKLECRIVALQDAISNLLDSVTPIPDRKSSYVPNLELARLRQIRKR